MGYGDIIGIVVVIGLCAAVAVFAYKRFRGK